MFDSNMEVDDFAMWLEDTLYSVSNTRAAVVDMSVYEVRDLPSFAEQARFLARTRRETIDRSPEDPT
jgi:hypothetical protein